MFVRLWVQASTSPLQLFVQYVSTSWIYNTTWPPSTWNVFCSVVRSDKDVEGWNECLKGWSFIEGRSANWRKTIEWKRSCSFSSQRSKQCQWSKDGTFRKEGAKKKESKFGVTTGKVIAELGRLQGSEKVSRGTLKCMRRCKYLHCKICLRCFTLQMTVFWRIKLACPISWVADERVSSVKLRAVSGRTELPVEGWPVSS